MIDQHHENVENVKADINLELSLGEVEWKIRDGPWYLVTPTTRANGG